jgi:hypothetical protein
LRLAYAASVGAVTDAEGTVLSEKCWAALGEAAGAQVQHQTDAEPTRRFLDLLSAALASGRAHVAVAREGLPLGDQEAWGWRPVAQGAGGVIEWRPQGACIGWLDKGELYLEPEAAFAVAQVLARDGGEVLNVGLPTLKRRLRDRGLLASMDTGRGVLTVRRVLGGVRHEVLHLLPEALAPTRGKPDQPDQSSPNGRAGSGSRSGWSPRRPET